MAQAEGAVPDDRCVGANQGVDEAPRVWEEIRGRGRLQHDPVGGLSFNKWFHTWDGEIFRAIRGGAIEIGLR